MLCLVKLAGRSFATLTAYQPGMSKRFVPKLIPGKIFCVPDGFAPQGSRNEDAQ